MDGMNGLLLCCWLFGDTTSYTKRYYIQHSAGGGWDRFFDLISKRKIIFFYVVFFGNIFTNIFDFIKNCTIVEILKLFNCSKGGLDSSFFFKGVGNNFMGYWLLDTVLFDKAIVGSSIKVFLLPDI